MGDPIPFNGLILMGNQMLATQIQRRVVRDDADEPLLVDDGQVADPACGHLLHRIYRGCQPAPPDRQPRQPVKLRVNVLTV
jgi:hypothetical protein